ncbi:hypothetical protein TD95_002486 [Thielaviopsis punctulata]|uniref:Anoctamin dimerisation domain-containing protein n=1 Tax=Thielaviopsis punctulata TaxID=72032 RepID=A0A0F4ZFM4_9PEZI|nr:hypothetical protein TD95_002486 [Thielaviopsis punctulata]
MPSFKTFYSEEPPEGYSSSLGVDYVIVYKVPEAEVEQAEAAYVQLIKQLTSIGLATEVRESEPGTLLIFVKVASGQLFANQVYRARLTDWLHGVRTTAPSQELSESLRQERVTPAERLRLVYRMLVKPRNEGGAGITPKIGVWRYVDSLFPLHNHSLNRRWLQRFSTTYLLDPSDLDEIRDELGEGVAYYFEFIQTYFRFLIAPAALGLGAWLLLGQFSWIYAAACSVWSVVFFEYWKQKEVDLAVRWGTRGVSLIQSDRAEFVFDREDIDPVTGELVKVYPPLKRFGTQLLQIPFALACVVVLGGLIVMCNSLEIFINEVYDGPFKQYLGLLPTILLSGLTPTFSAVLTAVATKLNKMENYRTEEAYQAALIQKEFVLNFMTSYMAAFFTSFVYTPFGHVITPFLTFWHRIARMITMGNFQIKAHEFHVNPRRISDQMFFFTVTAQIVNLATEIVVPYLKRKVFKTVKEFKHEKEMSPVEGEDDKFIARVMAEYELDVYDVNVDYREMVIQYGYLSLFSVAWPLAACCFLVNNWIELRSDTLKIAVGSRRPIPWRTDSIGPWVEALGFLSWLGSITSAAIVYLCSNSLGAVEAGVSMNSTGGLASDEILEKPLVRAAQVQHSADFTAWGLLLVIFLAEHLYLAMQFLVRSVMSNLDSPGLQKVRKERFQMKKRMLLATSNADSSMMANQDGVPGIEESERIIRRELNKDMDRAEMRGQAIPEEVFWHKHQTMAETIDAGRIIIAQVGNKAGKAMPSPKAE